MDQQNDTTKPGAILQAMLGKDNFSAWLGLVVDEYREGYCRLHFTVNASMLNGFHIVHGGILFSAADSAFAFACNSHGLISVALDAHISFIKAAKEGDVLTVEAKEIHTGNKTSFYDISIINQSGIIATFKGTAYRTSRTVIPA
ncbi:MAG: hotdog fold thioesterase [Bacteroidota bacterium]